MIPLCDVQRQYEQLRSEIDAAMQQVAAQGQYILGPHVRAFEEEVAAFCGAKYAIGVGSGTDALHLALRALDIGPGDQVITTPFTFVATTEAISMVGATPVFVDIDPATFNIDVGQIEAAIGPRTKAILPVHLYGQPCHMEPLMEMAGRHGLRVIEDCAQAMGASYRGRQVGTLGDMGCLSFFPSKNLGALGDGGMVLTNCPEMYERVEMLRRHGGKVKYHHEEVGLNSRLDELQAAILRVKLKHLPDWNRQRRQRAARYNQQLQEARFLRRPLQWRPEGFAVAGPEDDPAETTCVYHQYTVLLDRRSEVQQQLASDGVSTAVYYPIPLHLQKVHASLPYQIGDFPHAESVAARCLSLPMFPELRDEEIDRVAQCLHRMAPIAASS